MNAIRYLPFVGRPLIGLDAASEMIEKSLKDRAAPNSALFLFGSVVV